MLTPKQEAFAHHAAMAMFAPVKPTHTQIAIDAGYSPRTAHAAANRAFNDVKIQARIKEIRSRLEAEIWERTIATKLEAGQVATEIMRARFADFDIDNISHEDLKSPAIREISRTRGGGKDGRSPWESTKIKLESPLQAAEYLAKLYNWYEMPQNQGVTINADKVIVDARGKLMGLLTKQAKQLEAGKNTAGNTESTNGHVSTQNPPF